MNVREKLVELLKTNACPSPYMCDPACRYLCFEDCFPERFADHLISHGVTVQEWIPVTERLPESGVHVLLCCEVRYGDKIAGKYVCDGYYAEANKIVAGGFPDECNCEYSEEDDEFYLREGWYEVIKNWDDFDSVTVEDFVTHWMPLPQLRGKDG